MHVIFETLVCKVSARVVESSSPVSRTCQRSYPCNLNKIIRNLTSTQWPSGLLLHVAA